MCENFQTLFDFDSCKSDEDLISACDGIIKLAKDEIEILGDDSIIEEPIPFGERKRKGDMRITETERHNRLIQMFSLIGFATYTKEKIREK